MATLPMLLGILLAFLGVVFSSPTGNATTSEGATRASLAPRRNGYSDLPSDAATYNRREPYNAVPDYVMANDPDIGDDAIIYRRDEIYTAMQQGYEVLQRTRDPNPGDFVQYGNVQYPFYVIPENEQLLNTHFGQFGDDDNLDMYAWPLLWTNSYTGKYNLFYSLHHNPGQDRVVFDEHGIYLGVITRLPSEHSPNGGYRWCPPTNAYGRWIARWIGGRRGWNWTGVPPDGPDFYMPPTRWIIAASQLRTWWGLNPGGFPPTGSHAIQVNSSNPSSVNVFPPGFELDDDNPLQFPPADNSTGTWQTYVPRNMTEDLTDEFVTPDCTFAHDHGAGGYHQSCQTRWPGKNAIQVRITISGTGQDNNNWCQVIIENMKKKCGGHFNLLNGVYSCDRKYPGTATFSKAVDSSEPGWGQIFFGVDMHFWIVWPWAERDADHTCMAEAVELASCGDAGVKSFNGKWCRNVNWQPNPPLLEWSNDMGPPGWDSRRLGQGKTWTGGDLNWHEFAYLDFRLS